MDRLYKIREQDLDEELLKRLFSSGNTGIDLETVLNNYLKKTDKIRKENIDDDLLEELKTEIANVEIDLSNYREKTELIGEEDLSAELTETITNLQKQIDGITGTTDFSDISSQLVKLKLDIDTIQSQIESNQELAKKYTDDKIEIVTEDLKLAKTKLTHLETRLNNDVRLKSEKINEDDIQEDLLEKINSSYEAQNRTLNDIDFLGTKGKFISLGSENKLASSEILILGYFLKDESVVNTFLENKTIDLFFDISNNIKYELLQREIESTTTDPETQEEVSSTTTEFYYEETPNFFNSDNEYKYRLLFDQHSKTLYYLGENRFHTLISGNTSIEDTSNPDTITKKITFKNTSPDWIEETNEYDDTIYSIAFDKDVNDTIISDVYMLVGSQYRNSIVDIFVTDTTITIKAQDPFTGYFLVDSVVTEASNQLEAIAQELDVINGEVV